MNTNKFLIGGIIGGVASFLLGWLVWGMLLMNFMKEHTTEVGKAVMRADENIIWWALIAGNLLWGFVLSYVLNKSGANSFRTGAITAAVLSVLVAASYNCFIYAFNNIFDTTSMVVDIIANLVVGGIVGGIIGWYLGRGRVVV